MDMYKPGVWQRQRTMSPAKFARWLLQRGLTRAQIAVYLDLTERTIYMYLKGKTPIPTPVVRALVALDAANEEALLSSSQLDPPKKMGASSQE